MNKACVAGLDIRTISLSWKGMENSSALFVKYSY
jgi:hypothetical protein